VNPEKLMDELGVQLEASLKAMSKAKTMEEKVAYSQIVKNLSESMGVFLNLMTDMMDRDLDEFGEDE
jgi:hypothetical protein